MKKSRTDKNVCATLRCKALMWHRHSCLCKLAKNAGAGFFHSSAGPSAQVAAATGEAAAMGTLRA